MKNGLPLSIADNSDPVLHCPTPNDSVPTPDLPSSQPTSPNAASSVTDDFFHNFFQTPSFSLENDSLSIIENNEMLSNEIIDSFTFLLKQDFPSFYTQKVIQTIGLQNFAPIADLPNPESQYIQLHHLNEKTHFVLSHLKGNSIFLYDSLFTDLALCPELSAQLSYLYPRATRCYLCPSPKQTKTVDCGVIALCNLFSILLGVNPSSVLSFSNARVHLFSILNDTILTPFQLNRRKGRPPVPILLPDFSIQTVSVSSVDSISLCTDVTSKGAKKLPGSRKGINGRFNSK